MGDFLTVICVAWPRQTCVTFHLSLTSLNNYRVVNPDSLTFVCPVLPCPILSFPYLSSPSVQAGPSPLPPSPPLMALVSPTDDHLRILPSHLSPLTVLAHRHDVLDRCHSIQIHLMRCKVQTLPSFSSLVPSNLQLCSSAIRSHNALPACWSASSASHASHAFSSTHPRIPITSRQRHAGHSWSWPKWAISGSGLRLLPAM